MSVLLGPNKSRPPPSTTLSDPRPTHVGTTKCLGHARAGTRATQPHDPDPFSLRSLLSLGRRLHPTHATEPKAGYPRIFPGAQAVLASPRGLPRAQSAVFLHLVTPPLMCCSRTPHLKARRPASSNCTMRASHATVAAGISNKPIPEHSEATTSADASPHAREHTTRLSESQGQRAVAAIHHPHRHHSDPPDCTYSNSTVHCS